MPPLRTPVAGTAAAVVGPSSTGGAVNDSLGSVLSWHRKAVGMTGAEVAAAMEVSASAVSRWENDITSPKIVELRLLARVLAIPDYWNLLR